MSPGPSVLVDVPDADSPRYSAEYQQVCYSNVSVTSLEAAHPFLLPQYQEATVDAEEIEYEEEIAE